MKINFIKAQVFLHNLIRILLLSNFILISTKDINKFAKKEWKIHHCKVLTFFFAFMLHPFENKTSKLILQHDQMRFRVKGEPVTQWKTALS